MIQHLRGASDAKWHYDDTGRHYETHNKRTYAEHQDDKDQDGQESFIQNSMAYGGRPSLAAVSSTASQKALFTAANRRLLDIYTTDAYKKKADSSLVPTHDPNSLVNISPELVDMKRKHIDK